MEEVFSAKEFVQSLAQDLVDSFAKAGRATTPVLVGSARENAVRSKLEKLFPQAIGVSTGCVIDVDNNTSKQTDIIIYEKDICPVFSVNDTPESSYYPCEGVIAVGEVKSTLNTNDLLDSFKKIESVKRLKRFGNEGTCFRRYCSRLVIKGSKDEAFDQLNKSLDQIYGFIICEKIGLSVETFLEKCAEEIKKRPSYLVPNMIVSLHDGVLVYLDSKHHRACTNSSGADSIYFVNKEGENFQQILANLYSIITHGRSTDVLPFNKYIINNCSYSDNGMVYGIDCEVGNGTRIMTQSER